MWTRQLGGREPIFNLPHVVTVMLVAMIGVHAVRMLLLSPNQDELVIGLFAFSPDRYFSGETDGLPWPGGIGAMIWSPFTYALLHNDVFHLISNCTCFAAIGNLLVPRMSTGRFVAFCVVTAPLAALGELIMSVYQTSAVIGVSGVIFAMLGAMARFIYPAAIEQDGVDAEGLVQAHENSGTQAVERPHVHRRPLPSEEISPILETLRRPKVVQFILGMALLNIVFVVAAPVLVGGGAAVAWMVHVVGFIVGFVLYPLFVDQRSQISPSIA